MLTRRSTREPFAVIALLLLALLSACAPSAPETTVAISPELPATPRPSMPLPTPTRARPTITPIPTAGPYAELLALFDYDQQAPLDVVEVGMEQRGDVTVKDIAFTNPYGEKVTAYLVLPPGESPHPAILYVHWYGEPAGNRQEFLDEAVDLAKEGVVALLVDDYFSSSNLRGKWSGSDAAKDRQLVVRQVVELRRALDLLVAQAGVDPQRIAYVGHDFGALFGAVLAGVDPRLKTLVLMTPVPDFSDWFLIGTPLQPARRDEYRAVLLPVAPAQYVGHAAPASLFFQFARSDGYVSPEQASNLFTAASQPMRVEWYESDHALQQSAAATRDRLEWLRGELGLRSRQP
jgi:dienelactone hydrolase